MKYAFQLTKDDNVAVLLEKSCPGDVITLIGDPSVPEMISMENIETGHKIALRDILEKSDIVKFGIPIGFATTAIKAGSWIHLHNCASHFDEREYSLLEHDDPAPAGEVCK